MQIPKIDGINWGALGVITSVIAGAMWLGNLQGTINALDKDTIRNEKDRAFKEIKDYKDKVIKELQNKDVGITSDSKFLRSELSKQESSIKDLEVLIQEYQLDLSKESKDIKSSEDVINLRNSIIKSEEKINNNSKMIERINERINNIKFTNPSSKIPEVSSIPSAPSPKYIEKGGLKFEFIKCNRTKSKEDVVCSFIVTSKNKTRIVDMGYQDKRLKSTLLGQEGSSVVSRRVCFNNYCKPYTIYRLFIRQTIDADTPVPLKIWYPISDGEISIKLLNFVFSTGENFYNAAFSNISVTN